jgi:hypothetical protein
LLAFIGIVVLGFLLGMRHATDPDHVIAVTTIVTRQRGIAKAGLIGALWGMGHTFTIFVVGSAIILFKVAIPPRVGLSMEFAVGLMLILLGILNLTGVLRWLQREFSPPVEMASRGKPAGSDAARDRLVQRAPSTHRRDCSWPGRLGGGRPGRDGGHQRPVVGHCLPLPIWIGNHRRDDGDDNRFGFANRLYRQKVLRLEPRHDRNVGLGQRRLRSFSFLSNRHLRRPFFRQPAVDAALRRVTARNSR